MKKVIKKCTECGSSDFSCHFDNGEIHCRNCGLILEDKVIDFTHEWRNFEEDGGQKNRRAGAPSTYMQVNGGLGTSIGNSSDIYKLSAKNKNTIERLKKWQHRISTAIERNLKVAMSELKRASSFLNLPKNVEEEAARLYTFAVQRGLVRGRSTEYVIISVLYAACRIYNIPRTLEEMSESSGIDKRDIGRTYRFIIRKLDINILPSNPADYIPRFASSLRLSPKAQSKSVEILEMARDNELTSGRGPTGIAAAALYVAALMNGEKRTQREVADVAGVTEVTIRNRYKELIKKLKLGKFIDKKAGKRIRSSEKS